jgi:hypothetical protein
MGKLTAKDSMLHVIEREDEASDSVRVFLPKAFQLRHILFLLNEEDQSVNGQCVVSIRVRDNETQLLSTVQVSTRARPLEPISFQIPNY